MSKRITHNTLKDTILKSYKTHKRRSTSIKPKLNPISRLRKRKVSDITTSAVNNISDTNNIQNDRETISSLSLPVNEPLDQKNQESKPNHHKLINDSTCNCGYTSDNILFIKDHIYGTNVCDHYGCTLLKAKSDDQYCFLHLKDPYVCIEECNDKCSGRYKSQKCSYIA